MSKLPHELLTEAIQRLGFRGPTEAARHFGWVEKLGVSIPGIRHHFNGTRRPKKREAAQYARDLGLSLNRLLGLDDTDTTVGNIQITGKARWGEWLDAGLLTEPEDKGIAKVRAISVPRGVGKDMRYAVVIADGSVNRVIQSGDFAIYEPVSDQELEELSEGYLYILRRRGSLEERTVRKIAGRKADKLVLEAHSSDTRYAGRVTYPSSEPGEVVEVIGRVVGRYGTL